MQLVDIVVVDLWCACYWGELCHQCQFRLNLVVFCTVLIFFLSFFPSKVTGHLCDAFWCPIMIVTVNEACCLSLNLLQFCCLQRLKGTMLLRHILRLDALERCVLPHSILCSTHSDYALRNKVSLMLLPLSRLYGYTMIGRCSYSRRYTSLCLLPPACVRRAYNLTVSQSVC